MSRKITSNLTTVLLEMLAAHPEGQAIDQLAAACKGVVSKRTVQRELSYLIKMKQIVSEGNARARIYRLIIADSDAVAVVATPDLSAVSADTADIPLSPIAAELRAQIRKPSAERIPVAYRRDFLDAYRPNETPYLTADICDHLYRLGKTTETGHLAGTYARQILQRLLIDLAFASSHLEGNTYSLLETEKLIVLGEAATGKQLAETQMILNHKAAIEFLVTTAEEISLTPMTLRNLHALLSDNLLPNPAACGRLRNEPVGIYGSVYYPLAVGSLIEECFRQLLDSAQAIINPFEQAFFLMVHLPYLQPFDDVNKRVSRLSANIPLLKHNLCPLSFIDLPDRVYIDGTLMVYELNRIELLRDVFIWAYERSCQRYGAIRQSLGEPDLFRLNHREQFKQVIADIVRQQKKPTVNCVEEAAIAAGVADKDREHFVRLALVELLSLHEGNFARYQLRPSEFLAWQAKYRSH